MDVKVETLVMRSLANPKREVRPRQYRVRVDGMQAGFIGWDPGSKLMLHRRYSPIEVKEIEDKVKQQLFLENEVQSEMPPDVPPELMKRPDDEELPVDDLED